MANIQYSVFDDSDSDVEDDESGYITPTDDEGSDQDEDQDLFPLSEIEELPDLDKTPSLVRGH